MILQKTIEFLFEKYPDRKFTTFTDEDTKRLYNYLFSFVKEDELHTFNKEEIREAILEFFKEQGVVSVVFKGYEKIVIRVRPFDKSANTARIMEASLDYLAGVKKEILKNNQRADLVTIDEKIYKHLKDIIEQENPNLNKREIVKESLSQVFKLSPKDVVVFLKGKVFIRLFKEIPNKEVKESPKGRENRFNGLPPAELEKMERTVFPNGVSEGISEIMKSIYSIGLDFSRISNGNYEKNNIVYMQKGLRKFLKNKLSFDQFVIDGFINYILRKIFDLIHIELAKKLLLQFGQRVGTAEDFMGYYGGDVTVGAGGKYQKPKIEDSRGNWWQIPVIKAVAKQRILDMEKRREKQNSLKKTAKEKSLVEEALVESKEDLIHMKEEMENIKKELNQIFETLQEKRKTLMDMKKEIKAGREDLKEEAKKLAQEVKQDVLQENELLQRRDRLDKNTALKEHKIYEYNIKKNVLIKKGTEDKEKLNISDKNEKETKEKYDLIVEATAKALMKKKKKI